MRKRLATTLGAALLATMLLVPAAQAKNTPDPFAGELPSDLPGCFGNLNATFNHGSGIHEHGKDSKGPGYYFRPGGEAGDPLTPGGGQDFKEAREFTRAEFCG